MIHVQDFDIPTKYLNCLEQYGYSFIIDKRYKSEVIRILTSNFPSITKEELDEVINTLIY